MWFRSDLRLDDNPAFQACCETSDEVQAVFIYSENQLNSHNEANIKVDFLIKNIFSLSFVQLIKRRSRNAVITRVTIDIYLNKFYVVGDILFLGGFGSLAF